MTISTNLELDRAYHAGRCEGALSMLPFGPWSSEPHLLEFKHAGFDCILKRSSTTLVWCGYVAVPESHPAYKKHYDNINVEVHGGLTFADECGVVVCHRSSDPDDKVWWLGFDCSHSFDFSPGMVQTVALAKQELVKNISFLTAEILNEFNKYNTLEDRSHYWTVEEVQQETMKLADQLAQVTYSRP